MPPAPAPRLHLPTQARPGQPQALPLESAAAETLPRLPAGSPPATGVQVCRCAGLLLAGGREPGHREMWVTGLIQLSRHPMGAVWPLSGGLTVVSSWAGALGFSPGYERPRRECALGVSTRWCECPGVNTRWLGSHPPRASCQRLEHRCRPGLSGPPAPAAQTVAAPQPYRI